MIDGFLSFIVIVRQVSNATQRIIKNVLFKFPLFSQFDAKTYYRKFAEYVKRSKTLMRNIRVEFEVVVGSIPTRKLTQDLLNKLTNEEHTGEVEEAELQIHDFTNLTKLKSPMTPKLGSPIEIDESKDQKSPNAVSIISGKSLI